MVLALPVVPQTARPTDATGPRDIRSVRTLRISVTDRCNFRCVYCMPEDKLDWVPHDDVLTFEEIIRIAQTAIGLGVSHFKITGGEPLVRHDLPRLVAMLRRLSGRHGRLDAASVRELSMTTNGSLLPDFAAALRAAGLDRITVSMDSLDPQRFREITRGGSLQRVWNGIRAAEAAGFPHPKINCVVMRGFNDDELTAFAALTLDANRTVRFIEYMPLGRSALGDEYEQRFLGEDEMKRTIAARFGRLLPVERDSGHGPAKLFRLPNALGRVGFISAMSHPFCEDCNRLRLTAQGQLRSCLFDGGEVDLRAILRAAPPAPSQGEGWGEGSNADRASLRNAFIQCVAFKPPTHSDHGNRQMSQIGG